MLNLKNCITAMLAVACLAGSVQAVQLWVDFQSIALESPPNEVVTTTQAGFTAFNGTRVTSASQSVAIGAYTVTLTKDADSGTAGGGVAARNKGQATTSYTGGVGFDLYRDYIRSNTGIAVAGNAPGTFNPVTGWPGQEERPVMEIKVEGLSPVTAYHVTIYSWQTSNSQVGSGLFSLGPTLGSGTLGAVNTFVTGADAPLSGGIQQPADLANPYRQPAPTSLNSYAFTYMFTANALGTITLDFGFEGPTVIHPDNHIDPQVVLNGLVIDNLLPEPEPASLSLLALAGLFMHRRPGVMRGRA